MISLLDSDIESISLWIVLGVGLFRGFLAATLGANARLVQVRTQPSAQALRQSEQTSDQSVQVVSDGQPDCLLGAWSQSIRQPCALNGREDLLLQTSEDGRHRSFMSRAGDHPLHFLQRRRWDPVGLPRCYSYENAVQLLIGDAQLLFIGLARP